MNNHCQNKSLRSLVSLLGSALLVCVFASSTFAQETRQLVLDKAPVSDKRTALVIGNGTYANAPLKNPPNDATDMAAALKSLGFEVLSYTNLDQTGMKRAIREFGAKLRAKGGVGLFYYAGHGVQAKGVNYLIPIGAKVETEEEIEYESVEAGLILAQMESAKNRMNIVILDSCRNNPFARSFRSADKGLASIDAPSGTLLAYSTAPGSVASDGAGRNGLYTQELLKTIRTSGLGIEDVFKQVRISVRGATGEKQTSWESSSLTGDFYFLGNGNAKSGDRANSRIEALPVEKLPSADEVLADYAKAIGGERIKTISTIIQKGVVDIDYGGQKMTGKIEFYQKYPGKSLNLVKYSNGTMTKEVYDGDIGWIGGSSGGTKGATPKQIDLNKRGNAMTQANLDLFKTFYPSIKVKGKERLGEREMLVLDLKTLDNKAERMYFDITSKLLYRWSLNLSSVEIQHGVTYSTEIDFDDYVDVSGFQTPMIITQKASNGTETTKFNIVDLKYNVPLDDKLFKKP